MIHGGCRSRAGQYKLRTVVVISILLALCPGCVINAPEVAPSSPVPPVSESSAPATAGPSGSAKSPPPVPRSLAAGPGVYGFAYEGAAGTIQVPASIMDPRLERYGDYRRLAKARAITYLIAQVDNQSDGVINMYEVVVVTGDGRQLEATAISEYVDLWTDAFTGGGDSAKYNRGIELSNSSRFFLHPGAKGTAILGVKEPVTTVKRVFVYPAGAFDRVEARRIK